MLRNKNLTVVISIILVVLIICSVPVLLIDNINNHKLSVKTDSYEKLHGFLLPVLPQENQVSGGVVFIKVRKGPIQSNHKWLIFILPGLAILLLGSMEFWEHSFGNNLLRQCYINVEISLRIGGHSPPHTPNNISLGINIKEE